MWIKEAIKHKGALHKELGVAEGKKIPKAKLEKAAKHKGVEGKRARLAETLEKMHGAKNKERESGKKGDMKLHEMAEKRHDKKENSVKQAPKSKKKIEKVMHEYKEGKLHSGSKNGPEVKDKAQAVAIAISEAHKASKKKMK